jgi:hypothetical protein
MCENRVQDLLRITAAAKLIDRAQRMLVGIFLPVEVVQQTGQASGLLVLVC